MGRCWYRPIKVSSGVLFAVNNQPRHTIAAKVNGLIPALHGMKELNSPDIRTFVVPDLQEVIVHRHLIFGTLGGFVKAIDRRGIRVDKPVELHAARAHRRISQNLRKREGYRFVTS